MEFLNELRHLCESYPILFYIKILFALFCAVPSSFLLFAVLSSSIHANCRILLSMWSLSQLLVYASVCWLSLQYIIFEDEYFSEYFNPNSTRRDILAWYTTSWYASTCIELGIGLERGLSIRNPAHYHKSAPSYAFIFLYVVLSLALSRLISILILTGALSVSSAIGALLSNTLDISAIVVNFLVVYFAGRKDRTIEKQLDMRYQIRESYSIVQAMVPVYFMSTAVKILIIGINWLYVAQTVPFSVCEFVYIVLSELSCGLTSGMFLMCNARLRSKLAVISDRFSHQFGPTVVDKCTDTRTDNYFRMLNDSWK